jgi:hypothetical protein
MHWFSFISAFTGKPVLVNLDNAKTIDPSGQTLMVIQFLDGSSREVKGTIQDIVVHGGFPVTMIEAPTT